MASFLQCRAGNIAVSFALIAPVLLAGAGLAIDFQQRLAQKAALQDAADNLALRGARELLLENATAANVESLIHAWADKQYAPTLGAFDIDPHVDSTEETVTVAISQDAADGYFLSKILPDEETMAADATAQAQGVTNVCVIALEDEASDAIRADAAAQLDAPDCAILSNSTASAGVNVSGLANLTADLICSAGGAEGGMLNYSPAPVTDCPTYSDPLAERAPPDVGACDYNNLVVDESFLSIPLVSEILGIDGSIAGTLLGYGRADLQPGVYCGGLAIKDKTDVHLAPGVYVIKDGPLTVDLGARLYGKNVGFYFTGDNAAFRFKPASIIHLTAPKDGLMAGLLIYEDRSAPEGRIHRIETGNGRELLGTIYVPQGTLEVDSISPIADQSAYTAIVARNFRMSGTPTLVLNADYSATDIPTPEGIGATGGTVYLRD